jgi:hypothetical protein
MEPQKRESYGGLSKKETDMSEQMFNANLFNENRRARIAGSVIPADIGFAPRVRELFTLLKDYYKIVLDYHWDWHFYRQTGNHIFDADERFGHLVDTIRKLPREWLPFGRFEDADDPAGRYIVPTADEALEKLLDEAKTEYFNNLDPRFVRSFKGEAGPEEEQQVRDEIECGYDGGAGVISIPLSALRPIEELPSFMQRLEKAKATARKALASEQSSEEKVSSTAHQHDDRSAV